MEERLYTTLKFADAIRELYRMGKVTDRVRDDKGILCHCPGPGHANADQHPSLWIRDVDGDAQIVCNCNMTLLELKKILGLWEPIPEDTKWNQKDEQDLRDMMGEDATVHDLGKEREARKSTPQSWRGIRLREYDAGSQPQPAHGFVMPYDWAIFYPASVNEIHGPSESMKTWIALHTMVEAIKRGEHAAFLDFEDGPGPIAERLRAMGLEDDELDRIFYAYVTEPMPISQTEEIIGDVMTNDPSVVIVNGVIEAQAVQGSDTNDNSRYTAWIRIYSRPFADRGACVILIDHTSIKENASNSALGATAKMNIVQGASYLIEVGQEISPAKIKVTTGWTNLKLWKDRPGQIRQHGFKRRDVVAELHVEAHPDGTVRCTLEAASASVEDMFREQQEQASRDSAQRIMWIYLVNNRPKGGVKKTDFVIRGQKPDTNLGRNGTERLVDAWVNAGFVELRIDGSTKWMIAVGDVFPGDREEEEVSRQ